jgi:hypothetical protein
MIKVLAGVAAGVTGFLVAAGCVFAGGFSDTIEHGGAVMKKSELAAEIRALVKEGKADAAAAKALVKRLGTECDAGYVLAETLRSGDTAALAEAFATAIRSLEFTPKAEADLPEGFPEPSVEGLVRVKRYPSVRRARVAGASGERSTFMTLFRHIERNDIAMTAPVEMGIATGSGAPGSTMAFLYGSKEIGKPGRVGAVEVIDTEPLTVVSVGRRGSYDEEEWKAEVAKLEAWIAASSGRYEKAGEPRVLAYNSPFMPWFLKYSEVQIPIRPAR